MIAIRFRLIHHTVSFFSIPNFDIFGIPFYNSVNFINSVTRGFQKKIAELGVSLYPKVKILRDLSFERYLLVGPSNSRAQASSNSRAQASSNSRAQVRRPVPIPNAVPFGARGRKRTTWKPIMFIGQVTPNLDGNKMPPASANAQAPNMSPVRTPQPQPQPLSKPKPFAAPAKRTYARATSTPFVNRPALVHRPRGLSFPVPFEPPANLTASADDISINIDFDKSFGCLRFDSSSDTD